jgi:uncharacterized membrane protein (DUF4010 family)
MLKVFISVAALLVMSYRLTKGVNPGLTTEAAVLLTVLLGGLAVREPALTSSLGLH